MAKEGDKVFKTDLVTVEYTDKAKFHAVGEKATVHKLIAEKLATKGFAKIVKA